MRVMRLLTLLVSFTFLAVACSGETPTLQRIDVTIDLIPQRRFVAVDHAPYLKPANLRRTGAGACSRSALAQGTSHRVIAHGLHTVNCRHGRRSAVLIQIGEAACNSQCQATPCVRHEHVLDREPCGTGLFVD